MARDNFANIQGLEYDNNFRSYMASIFRNMGLGLLVTAITSFLVSQSPDMMRYIFQTPLYYLVLFAPLGMAMYYSFNWMKISSDTAQVLFFLYAFMVGLSLASIFMIYSGESIARIFFISASMFGTMSLWGYTTKKDLTGMGSFLHMGLIGLIIAMVVNIFTRSSGFQMMLSFIAVIIFTGLTAYDVQKMKNVYLQVQGEEMQKKAAMIGSFVLYLDFINLFLNLLYLFGNRRS